MIQKTNNKNELLGMVYKYIYKKRNLSSLEKELLLQGAKYVIKHLPVEWKQTISKT